jgi:two-component system LytT family response regulator
MLKAVIIDDEPKGRNILQQLLLQHAPRIRVLGLAANAEEGLQLIDTHHPDIVFLDVEMPGKSGFDLLREIKEMNFKVVFVSAHNHYSLKAIKFHAFDYLLKPIDLDELKQTIESLERSVPFPDKKIVDHMLQTPAQPGNSFGKIAIASVGSIDLIAHENILYFEAKGSSTAVHLAGDKKVVASKTLKEFEELLIDNFFIRIHHSYLINLKHVVKYIKGEGGSVLMDNGAELEVSRRRKSDFMDMLSNYISKK